MSGLEPAFVDGTVRLVPPEQTLARIEPVLERVGITRLADITGLDLDLGVPVYAAIRPRGLVFAGSHGKGMTHAAAKASALMEAIEFHHAENPLPANLREASADELIGLGEAVCGPRQLLAGFHGYDAPDYRFTWTATVDLVSGKRVWLPAGAVYFIERPIVPPGSNGLASGNHRVEASLHGLYELLERDAVSRLSRDGRLLIRERGKVIDWNSVDDDGLRSIHEAVSRSDSTLVLMWIPSLIAVHTFWAILLNNSPFASVSTFNVGYGTHDRPEIAAKRAVTEAVQSRITMVHAAREDIVDMPVYRRDTGRGGEAFRYFASLRGDTDWRRLCDRYPASPVDLSLNLDRTINAMSAAGIEAVYQADLTRPEIGVPVVKMIAPGLQFQKLLF